MRILDYSFLLVQVAMHAWKDGATSTLIQAEPLLAMAEAASLTVQTLLRGSTCSILVMHASERAARGSASKGTRPDEQAGMLKTAAISLANDGIPLPALSEPGLSVSFRCAPISYAMMTKGAYQMMLRLCR